MRASCTLAVATAAVLAATGIWAQQAEQTGNSQPAPQSSAQTKAPQWAQELMQRIEKLEQALGQRQKTQDRLPQWAQELILRVDRLEEQIEQLTLQTGQALAAVRDLARREGQTYYPNLLGKMQNPKFRQEVQRVVQGTLIIDNQTGLPQRFYINGSAWIVPPGRSQLQVPVGTVYAHLPWESPQNKKWNDWKVENGQQVLYLRIGY